jgi:hypothetical protein
MTKQKAAMKSMAGDDSVMTAKMFTVLEVMTVDMTATRA